MGTAYATDVIAWANEQAALLRSGQLSSIDIENIAKEILDVGKSEQRELGQRMAGLLAYLLEWQFQPEHRCKSWSSAIRRQRFNIQRRLQNTPSLHASLVDADWWSDAWMDAVAMAQREAELDDFPDVCPWAFDDILTNDWLPA